MPRERYQGGGEAEKFGLAGMPMCWEGIFVAFGGFELYTYLFVCASDFSVRGILYV